jgi:HD-GYP domain-containing protein (c-di-GMP phosphodiesterase class II)
LRVVRSHHERWDGSGYPDGIGGTEIPLGARIFAVADALDAMTSDRPYRKAMTWAAAGREILAESNRQFDPHVVDSFVARERSFRSIRREFAAVAA